MKKILILVLSLISIIRLTSCHREVTPHPSPTPTDPLSFICLHKWNIKNRIEVSETEIEIEYVCYKCGEIKKEITKKPILPSDSELENNPRSRSAKLRIAEII